MRQRLAILGSTGSIGRQTLGVVDHLPDRFEVVALAAGHNAELLQEQVDRYRPRLVSVADGCDPRTIQAPEVLSGAEGLEAVATMPEADIVVVATSGHSAIRPTLEAIRRGKTIALANKEAIVCAGEILVGEARRRGVEIRPVDSEHSAVWQCLSVRHQESEVDRVTLTASGGPFRDTPAAELATVTVEQAMAHPTWRMGSKVTVDSATLMNKGLEVIEAHWLFDLPYERIDTVIHPQSIVHALVSFADGSVVAHLAVPDMRLPIQYALTYPERPPAPHLRLDIAALGRLEFSPPDPERFPALELARAAGEAGSTYPTVLSSADEVAVAAFIAGRLGFTGIVDVVRAVLDRHQPAPGPLTLEAIAEADAWARREAETLIAATAR
ncbi:1-deoxy-D-xylulose-5-phosphate reductoisomerase [Sphaerobacter thermophilus]|uniref:1-deoxy-D-xylulose 5-phosphate reductoisomerase n=1 Tax=Sphaerobacter thermophilus (strain ATCC 49802 / DSM 20745 / KCCM 41009 / NCIMB 13125 / S 6022) TaxID=479434 RepID=D1C4K7_SPHTD|nr:1-deoxy-D-xylulose-5-phosphate reductoisomerase [Sphaerobacter thermophilus]ACZ39174.1 1-deoxy-D-xylulose 5-phosphate reductoisomerase [Sphaerobacter thermophilus DSM 20745]